MPERSTGHHKRSRTWGHEPMRSERRRSSSLHTHRRNGTERVPPHAPLSVRRAHHLAPNHRGDTLQRSLSSPVSARRGLRPARTRGAASCHQQGGRARGGGGGFRRSTWPRRYRAIPWTSVAAHPPAKPWRKTRRCRLSSFGPCARRGRPLRRRSRLHPLASHASARWAPAPNFSCAQRLSSSTSPVCRAG